MSISQNLSQTQKQGLNIFLLQQKAANFAFATLIPTIALEEHIKNQLEENPALEEVNAEEMEGDDNLELQEPEVQMKNELNEIEEYFEDDEIPDYKTHLNNRSKDEPSYSFTAVYYQSFQEQLKDQLKEYPLSPETKPLVEYIIDSLDEDGYLHTSIRELTEAYSFAASHFIEDTIIEDALKILQQFEPLRYWRSLSLHENACCSN